ncbi:MAG: cysteine-rich CWC family protein [Gammaproteobacteria bacterium]|nr:cysteine-rich CWC family protein [Gammaproteobacteria bacterium]
MKRTDIDVDPARCPLCGAPNECARTVPCGSAAGKPCWCVTERFPAELIARVPASARGRACICARCAAGGHAGD